MVEFKLGHSTIVIVGPLFRSLQKEGHAYHELQIWKLHTMINSMKYPLQEKQKHSCSYQLFDIPCK